VAVSRQAQLLELSRSSVYYTPRPISERDLRLMRRIDELHLKWPFYGARKWAAQLRREGHDVGRRHVTTLMWLATTISSVCDFHFCRSRALIIGPPLPRSAAEGGRSDFNLFRREATA